jgi:hypothetical protein
MPEAASRKIALRDVFLSEPIFVGFFSADAAETGDGSPGFSPRDGPGDGNQHAIPRI